MTPSPQSDALAARQVLIGDMQQDIAHRDASLKSIYAENVLQWKWNYDLENGKPGVVIPPIPVPPLSWILVPHTYTDAEKLYDAAWPGIPPLLDESQSGPPVAAQYVLPVNGVTFTPVGTRVNIGSALRDGEYAALPDDNMPAGYVTRAPDGTFVRKLIQPTPFGNAQWYQEIM